MRWEVWVLFSSKLCKKICVTKNKDILSQLFPQDIAETGKAKYFLGAWRLLTCKLARVFFPESIWKKVDIYWLIMTPEDHNNTDSAFLRRRSLNWKRSRLLLNFSSSSRIIFAWCDLYLTPMLAHMQQNKKQTHTVILQKNLSYCWKNGTTTEMYTLQRFLLSVTEWYDTCTMWLVFSW